jgi:hypothetical protein
MVEPEIKKYRKCYRILLRDRCEIYVPDEPKFLSDYIEVDEFILNENGIWKKYKSGLFFYYNIIGVIEVDEDTYETAEYIVNVGGIN